MATAGTITFELDANGVKLLQEFAKAERAGKKMGRNVEKDLGGSFEAVRKSAMRMGAALGTATAAAASLAAVKLVNVQREFDVINASLVTVTGSSEAAAEAFDRIKEFAKSTPYDLAQVSSAFVKLKALGLDPSERALTSYGNTSAAMGKDLMQMIEAVADATTGEFERLKEFGIKARQEGDNVALTFRGVTTTIKKSADEIQEYLLKIGETDFGGAMAERAATLDGALSNLGDSWDNLFLTISQSGIGKYFEDTARQAGLLIDSLESLIRTGSVLPEQTRIAKEILDLQEQLNEAEAKAAKPMGIAQKLYLVPRSDTAAREAENLRSRIAELQAQYESLTAVTVPTETAVQSVATATETAAAATQEAADTVDRYAEALRQAGGVAGQITDGQVAAYYDSLLNKPQDNLKALYDAYNQAGQDQSQSGYVALMEKHGAVFEEMTEETEQAYSKMSEYSIQAARNMQSHLADYLFDPFDQGLKGMLTGFVDILRRMAAEATAAMIFDSIGGAAKGASGGGGWFGNLVGAFAGFFDSGGHIPSGKFGMVAEGGSEFIRVPSGGYLVPGPADVVGSAKTAQMGGHTVNVYVQGGGTYEDNRRAGATVGREVNSALARAGRYR